MENVTNKGFTYQFGNFVLDPEGKTLYANGRPLHLPAKEFETLLLLVEHNGRALSKDELMSAIWGDTFVEEVNLAKQISRLRKVLKAEGTDYIETIPKHGYRFTAELRHVEPNILEPILVERRVVRQLTISREIEAFDDPELPATRLVPAPRSRFDPRWLLLLLILGLGAATLAWFARDENPSADRAASVRSVAVLPFSSLSIEDDQLRFGLTDTLTTKLSSMDKIIVRPTNAARGFDGSDAVDAGRSLRVDAVLSGNVQRTANQIKLTVQLVDVRDGHLIWGESFVEKDADLFRLQDAVAAQVARAFELTLTGDEIAKISKRYTTNPDAHYSYVKGRYFWNKRTADNFRIAIGHFNDAIERDPNYALAYAGLADAYSLLADYRGAPVLESYDNARQAALKAISLDSELAEAHQWYSEYLAAMGRFDEALSEIRRAQEIDPLAPVINAGEVWVLYHARRYDEAIDMGRKLSEMNPQFAEVHEYLKRCYDQKGMYREAIEARQTRRKLAALDPTLTPPIKRASTAANARDYWSGRLDQELEDLKTEPPSTFDLAEIYAQLGDKDKDKAFEWLEKAFAERTYTMMYLKVAPNLDPLRSDPRFTDMLKRVGLAAGPEPLSRLLPRSAVKDEECSDCLSPKQRSLQVRKVCIGSARAYSICRRRSAPSAG